MHACFYSLPQWKQYHCYMALFFHSTFWVAAYKTTLRTDLKISVLWKGLTQDLSWRAIEDPSLPGGTWPMFGYRGAAEGLKSWPCLEQGYAKNPTLCRTTASISRLCLGQVTKCTLSGLHEFKLFNKSFKSEKSCSMRLKPSSILMTL